MLSAAARSRFHVVLVGARNPQNIGAAARAMHDFGFRSLRFVNEYAVPLEAAQIEAVSSAVAAGSVLQAAQAFNSVAEAIADCSLVVGTTAIGERTLTHPVLPLAETAPTIVHALEQPTGSVALLFGSEKTGLTNDQLSFCSRLTTIPMFQPEDRRHLSMNLGQSVAVCLYELVRGGLEGAKAIPPTGEAPATAGDRERLTELLLEVMAASGYAKRFPANSREHVVRKLAQSLGAAHDEAETWMGFLRMLSRNETKKGS